MCYIFIICRPSLLFFHQKNSRKFRIHSFRIHHRTAKLLALLLSKKVWTLVLTLVQTNSDHVLKFVNCIVHQILHPITKLQIRCTNLMELLSMELLSFETNLELELLSFETNLEFDQMLLSFETNLEFDQIPVNIKTFTLNIKF